MNDTKTPVRPATTYEADYFAWTQEQAARLREVRPNSLDWENIAEEIESLGRSDKRAIESRVHVLLVHLLKWWAQPGQRKGGWRSTIQEQRRRIGRETKDCPSLADYPGSVLIEEYEAARLTAIDETGLFDQSFPETCPFTIAQILDPDFWPEAVAG
jgi:hypothetical protein